MRYFKRITDSTVAFTYYVIRVLVTNGLNPVCDLDFVCGMFVQFYS